MKLQVARGVPDRALRFDDETVVFNPLSWDTHILNAAAAAVFDYIADAPRSPQDIEAFLAEALASDQRDQCAEHAARLVRDLMALGLIEQVTQAAHAHC